MSSSNCCFLTCIALLFSSFLAFTSLYEHSALLLSLIWLFETSWTITHQAPVYWILQARILVWVAILFSMGSSWPRDWTQVSYISGGFFLSEPPGKPLYEHSLSVIKCYLLYPGTLGILIIVLYYWSDNSYILYLCLDAYLSFQTVFLPFSMLCKFLLAGHNLVKVTVVNRLLVLFWWRLEGGEVFWSGPKSIWQNWDTVPIKQQSPILKTPSDARLIEFWKWMMVMVA